MMKPASIPALTLERLREVVTYDPDTGEFWPVAGRNGIRPWKPLGHVEPNGYRRVMIDGRRYLAHRLAWLYMTGSWPVETVDHRDLQRDNNRWSNLRAASMAQQFANRRYPSSSGLKGAVWNRFRGYWQSSIRVGGKIRRLGTFGTAEEAHEAYCRAANEIHGEFARTK